MGRNQGRLAENPVGHIRTSRPQQAETELSLNVYRYAPTGTLLPSPFGLPSVPICCSWYCGFWPRIYTQTPGKLRCETTVALSIVT